MRKMPRCPACDYLFLPSQTCQQRFDCPGCGTTLRPLRKPLYRWLRLAGCYIAGIAAARIRGWDWSLIVFVVSLYAFPIAVLFDSIVLNLFPAKQFETLPDKLQTLNLSSDRPNEWLL